MQGEPCALLVRLALQKGLFWSMNFFLVSTKKTSNGHSMGTLAHSPFLLVRSIIYTISGAITFYNRRTLRTLRNAYHSSGCRRMIQGPEKNSTAALRVALRGRSSGRCFFSVWAKFSHLCVGLC